MSLLQTPILGSPEADPLFVCSGNSQGFPTGVLPDVVRDLVEEGSRAIGVPPDFLGAPLLAVTGALIGSAFSLEVKSGWNPCGNLWVGVVGDPGTGKTPALRAVMDPFKRLQSELSSSQQEDFFTTDITVEAVGQLLQESSGLVGHFDELLRFVKTFDRFKRGKSGGDRQFYLESWSQETIKVDRVGRDRLLVERPVLSIVGSIQPEVLDQLRDEARISDGFVDRFLWVYPEAEPEKWTEEVIREQTNKAWEDLVRDLVVHRRNSDTVPIPLSPDAKSHWASWHEWNRQVLASETGVYRGFCTKLPEHVLRLTLILHGLEHPVEPDSRTVGLETIKGATTLAEYFRREALKVISLIEDPSRSVDSLSAQVRRIVSLNDEPMNKRALHKALGGSVRAEDLNAALDALLLDGVIEVWKDTSTGGRPAEMVALKVTR